MSRLHALPAGGQRRPARRALHPTRRPAVLALTLVLLASPAYGVVVADAPHAAGATRERIEILLATDRLPAGDRAHIEDRRQAITDAIAAGLPL